MNAVTSETGEEDFSISDPDFDLNDQLNNSERQSLISSTSHKSSFSSRFLHWLSLMRFARHTLGIVFLLVTVLLFTTSNFLASTIFSDHSYSKPYFITYINSSFFSIFLVMFAIRRLWAVRGSIRRAVSGKQKPVNQSPIAQGENQSFLKPHAGNQTVQAPESQSSRYPAHGYLAISPTISDRGNGTVEDMLNTRETAKLGFEFCMLWFAANYFVAAGLEFTTVASVTILTATCGIWTLMFGSLMGVEQFTSKKVIGVLATLAGVILTSSVDLSGENDKNRGSFPHKSQKQIAFGDALAFISAIMYGVYTSVLKKKAGNEERVNMPLFFGFVGIFNMITLLPGLIVLHATGVEKFQFPPTRRILAIVLINSAISLVSDVCWAYSMLLTSPIVVTVGLSLTIPLSLIGQIIINAQSASLLYWVGAGIVFLSFILVNHEGRKEAEKNLQKGQTSRPGSNVVTDPH